MASKKSVANLPAAGDTNQTLLEQLGAGHQIAGIGRISAAKMRDAVVLSEILMPPLALRDLDEWC